MAEETAAAAVETKGDVSAKKKRRGILSRMWRGIFGGGREDYEKRLQYLSKEENLVHSRIRRRAQSSRKFSTNLIVLSVVLEVVAVGYAIMTTRSSDLNWQMRAVRVLPMFLLPALASLTYSSFLSFIRMLDRKDQKTLERLRAERQEKIDELKERTNYYTTQQLIQKYDLDPAAKAAAATVLASKLGADSGLKVYVGDENKVEATGRSHDVQLVQSDGLRKRKPSHSRSHSTGSAGTPLVTEEIFNEDGADGQESSVQNQRMVEHYKGTSTNDGGWLARIAALLVGEDPTQCYALICGNCHMHNGLARKEDFPYITYYCPHCHALNGSGARDDPGSGLTSGVGTPLAAHDASTAGGSNASAVTGEAEGRSNLATVKELPAGEGDEKEVDGQTS